MINRAVENPLVRGGLTLVAGVLTGNILGFGRVALMAYLLGTHSHADSLAVAMGPLDTLNQLLLNSIVFAFVPDADGLHRARSAPRLFSKLTRCFAWVVPGSRRSDSYRAVADARVWRRAWTRTTSTPRSTILRILALSTSAGGSSGGALRPAVHGPALRPTAFYQAAHQRLHDRWRAQPVEVRGSLRVRHWIHGRRVGATGLV